jgi:hypothetical protein
MICATHYYSLLDSFYIFKNDFALTKHAATFFLKHFKITGASKLFGSSARETD